VADELSVLLTVEAVDKATFILGKIGDVMDSMSAKLAAASSRATMSAAELQVAQDRAAASATAYERSLKVQADAQNALRVDTEALTRAQEAYTQAAATAAGATKAQADAVELASAKQVASLDALSRADQEVTVRSREAAAAAEATSTSLGLGTAAMKAGAVAAGALALATVVIGDKSVKAGADFQSSMLKMVTSAGEARQNLASLSAGVLQISMDTATSTDELTKGLYLVESAGYRTSNALTILRAASEGARAEGADLGEVSNALTTIMRDYGYKVTDAVKVTDMMVAAVGSGKMTTQAFASSLSTVLPTAHSAGISFEQIAGAIATMTAQGITAQQATTDLNHAIQKLESPTIDSVKYMAQLGVNAQDLSANLGKRGLTGTLEILTNAIGAHIKDGKVLVSAFNQSQSAAQDLKIMLASMPPDVKSLAEELKNGSMSFGEYNKEIKALSGPQHALGVQFVNLLNQSMGFNQLLKSGQPAALEYTAALKKVVGDSTSLQTVLALTNGGLGTFRNTVSAVAEAASKAGAHVEGWSDIQHTFNFRSAQLKDTVHALAISIGTGLLPAVTALVSHISRLVSPLAEWASHHQHLAAIILGSVGAISTLIAVVLTGALVFEKIKIAVIAFREIMGGLMLSMGPVGLAIAAIGVIALVVATHWSQTKAVLSVVWKWLVDAAKTTADFFVGVWHGVVDMWDSIWSEIGGTVRRWWPLILAPLTGGMSLIVAVIIKYRKDIASAFESVWSGLVDLWNATGGKLVSMINHAWHVVSASVSAEWNHIVEELGEIWNEIIQLWNVTGGKLVSYVSGHWTQISHATSTIWGVIWGAVSQYLAYLWSAVTRSFGLILDTIKTVWDTVWGATKMAWDLIWGAVKGAMELIWGVIKAVFDVIWGFIRAAWDTIIMVFEAAWDTIKGVINVALDIIEGVLKVFIDLFTGNWSQMWKDINETAYEVATTVWNTVKSIFGDLWRWLVNIWNDIADGVIGAWHAIWTGISGFLKSIWDGIVNAFSDGIDTLRTVWNDLKKLAADPVNFVIDTVYNHGIMTLWNDVSGVFGGPKLSPISPLKFAAGGMVPGAGFGDTVPAWLTPGEFVLSHDMINSAGGIGAILAMFGAGSGGRGGGYAGGGIVSSLVGGIKSAIGAVANLALGGLRDTARSAFDVINNLLGTIPGATTGLGREMIGAIGSLEKGVLKFLGDKDQTAPKGVGGQLDAWTRQALAATGKPMSWFAGLETIAMHESGGNPNAINNYDINAQHGDPSRGLMQTIGATFSAYHQSGTSWNIFDPVANIAAAINYIASRYGSINNVPGLVSMAHGGPYVGYEVGTWDTGSFAHMALLHPHEAVIPAEWAGAMRGRGGGGALIIDLRGSTISSDRDADAIIAKIEARLATWVLPAGGTRIRM